jgi:hypothetical protein
LGGAGTCDVHSAEVVVCVDETVRFASGVGVVAGVEVLKTSSFAVGRGRSRAVGRCRRRGFGGIP